MLDFLPYIDVLKQKEIIVLENIKQTIFKGDNLNILLLETF